MDRQSIISRLNSEYTTKRSVCNSIAEANKAKALSNPKIKELFYSIKALQFEIGKNQAENKDTTLSQKALKELKVQFTQELNKAGFKPSDLTPNYICKLCQDTGKIGTKFCKCFKTQLYNNLLSVCGAKKELATFDKYNEAFISDKAQLETLKKLNKKFTTWCAQYPNINIHTFVLCGKTGVGKTFLAECVASELLKQGYLVLFAPAFDLNQTFLTYHTTFDKSKDSILNLYKEPDFLVIDDLGTEPIYNNVTLNYLCALLEYRINNNKSTFITTNLGLDEIKSRYGDRIFSRLGNKEDSGCYLISGKDLRIKQ